MQLLEKYTKFLNSVDAVISEDGKVLVDKGQGPVPYALAERELVLPTPAFLKNPQWDSQVAFHPLSESISRGESEVIQFCVRMICSKVMGTYLGLYEALLMTAVKDSQATPPTPGQGKYLAGLGNTTPALLEKFSKILGKTRILRGEGEDRRAISLFLKRGGAINGERFARVCVVGFPLYEAICKAEEVKPHQVFGVQLTAKELGVLKTVHEVLLPGSDDGVYSAGTNSTTAPYFVALTSAYTNLAEQLNKAVKTFQRSFKSLKPIDTSWFIGDNLNEYRNVIPPMPFNEGEIEKGVSEQPAVAQPAQAVSQPVLTQPQFQQPVYQQPVAFQQPQQGYIQPQAPQQPVKPSPAPKGTISFNDIANQLPHPGFGMQMPQMQMPMMQMGYPQAQMGMPMNQPPMPPVSQPQMGYPQMGMQPQMGIPMQGGMMGISPYQMGMMNQPPMPPVSQPQMGMPMGYPQQMPMGYPQQPQMGYPQQMGYPPMMGR